MQSVADKVKLRLLSRQIAELYEALIKVLYRLLACQVRTDLDECTMPRTSPNNHGTVFLPLCLHRLLQLLLKDSTDFSFQQR